MIFKNIIQLMKFEYLTDGFLSLVENDRETIALPD